MAQLVYILGFLAFVIIAQYQSSGGDFIGLCRIINMNDTVNNLGTSSLLDKGEEPATMQCGVTIYVLLIIVGIASSAIKANIVPFGAEQVGLHFEASVLPR